MDKELRYFTLPNILTLMNLVSGSIAILYAFEKPGNLTYAATFIFIAAFFDFTDGFAARLTNSVSKLGKYLDSLSDIVSFGIAPALIVFQMLKTALEVKVFSFDLPYTQVLILLSPVVLIIAAALRLAKFDADRRQTDYFLGMPVPVSAIFFASLPFLNVFDPDNLIILKSWLDVNMPFEFILAVIGVQVYVLTNFWFYVISIFIFAVFQLVEIPMFSFKTNQNKIAKYTFLIISVLLLLFFQCFILPFVILFYILFALGIDVKNAVTNYENAEKPKTWISESIIGIFIFVPLAVPALIYSLKVRKYRSVDNNKANRASQTAAILVFSSFFIGIISSITSLLLFN